MEKSERGLIVQDGWEVNASLTEKKESLFNDEKMSSFPTKIWIKTKGRTLGCCMCFKSKYKDAVLPFPNDDHDVWTINILSRICGVIYLYEKCILHRLHGNNVSVPYRRQMIQVIRSGMILLFRLYLREIKVWHNGIQEE